MKNYGVVDKGILRWFFIDFLSLSFSRKLISIAFFFAGVCLFVVSKRRSIEYVMTAQRLYPNKVYGLINKSIMPILPDYYKFLMCDDVGLSVAASRSIILKMPKKNKGSIDKGIIDITFTDTNRFYYHNIDITLLKKYFHVVLEPSWAGYCLPEVLFWTMNQEPVFVQSTEVTDRRFLRVIDSNLVGLTFGASDWVNYTKFFSLDGVTKYYDSVYVANYSPGKRLHLYFKALMRIKRSGIKYKGAIVCARWGGGRDTALKLIDYYDVADMLDVHESLNAEQINKILNRSKCNILLSLKEGSNRSLFEAMFCDVPVIALKNNVGMNKDYINESTGMLVDENRLADGLLRMQREYGHFSPRQWAMNNISPEVTTRKLVNIIKSSDPSFCPGEDDVIVKTNDPEVSYLDKDISLDRKYFMERVLTLFDLKLGVPDCENALLALTEEFYVNSTSIRDSSVH